MTQCSPEEPDDTKNEFDSAAGGTLYLIVIQIASRVLTFAGNQFVLRYLSLNLLGIAVQLELYSVSVLYFSRESLRVALQRQPFREFVSPKSSGKRPWSTHAHQTQAIVNLSSFAITLGVPLTIGFGWLYYSSQHDHAQIQQSSDFGLSLLLYASATLIELLSEPCFVVIQERLLYKSRARSETTASVFKCAATCSTALVMSRRQMKSSVLPFAIGQIVYATVLAWGYLATVLPVSRRDDFSILIPRTIDHSSQFVVGRFYRPLVSLAMALYAQSVFKQILTQGDALVLGFLASLEDQGAFALASNYGGLIARLVFQPVEESSRNLFGKLLSGIVHDEHSRSDPDSNLRLAFKQLRDILHLYSLVAVLSSCFLYTLLPLSVKLLVGPKWFTADVAAILSTFCYYIPFMAYNGILDALVTSVATPAELQRQSMWMAAFTAAYLPVAYVLVNTLQLGARGLVLANILNMSLRILWSCRFVSAFAGRNHYDINVIRDIMPGPGIAAVGTIAAGIMRRKGLESNVSFGRLMEPLTISLVGGCTILFFDRIFLIQFVSTILPERLAIKIIRPKHTARVKSR